MFFAFFLFLSAQLHLEAFLHHSHIRQNQEDLLQTSFEAKPDAKTPKSKDFICNAIITYEVRGSDSSTSTTLWLQQLSCRRQEDNNNNQAAAGEDLLFNRQQPAAEDVETGPTTTEVVEDMVLLKCNMLEDQEEEELGCAL